MIRPKEMVKVRIVGPTGKLRTVIETLYDARVLHLVDFKKTIEFFFDIGRPFEDADTYSRQLISLRSIISYFAISGGSRGIKNLKKAQKKFLKLENDFKSVTEKLNNLKADEKTIVEQLNDPILKLNLKKSQVGEYKYLHSFIGVVKRKFEDKLVKVTTDYELKKVELEKQIVIALFVPKKHKEKVQAILAEAGYTEYPVPLDFDSTKGKSKLNEIQKQLANLQNTLNQVKQQSQFLIDYENLLTQLNEKAEAPVRFASSKNAFVASGWVPKEKAQQLKSILDKETSNRIQVEFAEGKDAPIALENPKIVKPFEFLLDLYSLPKYYELDPTFVAFFTFPLFFGFMLGDVGYGLVSLGLALVLRKFGQKGLGPLTGIVAVASLTSILFGFVFGEFFGYEFIEHPVLNRVHDVNTMLIVAVAVGAIHITLGFILGFVNEYLRHGLVHAVLAKGAWLILELGIGLVAYSYLSGNSSFQLIGGVVALASILMLVKGEGIRGIIELPSIFSNMLSYARLYALGLASVSLAMVINQMAHGLIVQGGLFVLLAGVILILGHTLNLLLGLLGPFLQSLRLHYVEFFTKFFEGGGTRYNPFGIRKHGG